MKQNIKGMLSLEELEELVKREEIDTVLMGLYGSLRTFYGETLRR